MTEGMGLTAWALANWEWIMLGFYKLEKIVKLTPTDKDDILLDVVFSGVKKLVASMVGKVKK